MAKGHYRPLIFKDRLERFVAYPARLERAASVLNPVIRPANNYLLHLVSIALIFSGPNSARYLLNSSLTGEPFLNAKPIYQQKQFDNCW